MADARVKLTVSVRIVMPQMTEWQAVIVRKWMGPVRTNWIVQHGPRQLERHAYPGQASQRAVRVPPRCTCWYGISLEDAFTVFATPRFTIRRSCPHHGDAARFCCPHHQ